MAHMRTVTLEILRPGPSHNQLLSPLTNYLAICDNRGAVTLNIPLEHRELMRQREALAYTVPRTQREAQLFQSATVMGDLLGSIPSLNAALAQTEYGQEHLIHLRLVLSASELALLPFELADAPQSFPGEAKPLLLQSIAPITLTREVRMATIERASWSRPLKILVAVASPEGVTPVPVREHLLALRSSLDLWVPAKGRGGFSKIVTLLPRASLKGLREACEKEDFTHVHILAHGHKASEAGEARYGLAFFDSTLTKLEVVRGSHLAHALRTHRKNAPGFSSPNVVTVASCDSGNVASVVFPGASLAHDLHEAGLPWVIASQFPLSMRGSVLMTEVLYGAFARGQDPRVAVHHLRQCLRAECMETHDWASIVAYAAVPSDFDDQVDHARREQAERAINIAFERADDFFQGRIWELDGAEWSAGDQARFSSMLDRLNEQLLTLQQLAPKGDTPSERRMRAEIRGRLGSAEKRRAYALHQKAAELVSGAAGKASAKEEAAAAQKAWQSALARARDHYLEAAKLDMTSHWVMTQYLSLCAVLDQPLSMDYWTVAKVSAELDLDRADPEVQAWAHANLAELHLLSLRFANYGNSDRRIRQTALDHVTKLRRLVGTGSFVVPSTRRQFERYLNWWKPKDLHSLAEALVKALRDDE